MADLQHLPGCDGNGAGCWVVLHPKCPCCGEPMGNDTGHACSFCIAWGCADDPKHAAEEPIVGIPRTDEPGTWQVTFTRPAIRNQPRAPRRFVTFVEAANPSAAEDAASLRMETLYGVTRLHCEAVTRSSHLRDEVAS